MSISLFYSMCTPYLISTSTSSLHPGVWICYALSGLAYCQTEKRERVPYRTTTQLPLARRLRSGVALGRSPKMCEF